MLHAAYAALDPSDRKHVDATVEDAFRASRDERLRALSDELAALPARDRLDALHSLLGTQVAQLPADLERYYAILFGDRQAVVSAFWSYKTAFDAVDSQLDRLAQEIDGMKAQVAAMHQQYDAAGGEADRLTAQLKDVKSKEQGQALVAQQNVAVDRANDLARRLPAAVAQVNVKIEAYNALVVDDQQRITPLSSATAS
jgi:chromosome segregation ATPase